MPLFFRQPQRFSPASNPLLFVFGEETGVPGAKPNRSYKVTLIINGATHSTHQVFPERVYETRYYGRFDASQIVNKILKSPIVKNDVLVQPYSSAWLALKIEVQEIYGDPPVPVGLVVESDEIIAFNGAFRIPEWLKFRHEAYLPDNNNSYTPPTPNTRYFLTNFPRECAEFVGMDETKFLGFLYDSDNIQMQVNLYDVAGVPVPGASWQDNFGAVEKVNLFNVSPQNIIDQTTISQAMFDLASYYTIKMNDAGTQGSEQGGTEIYKLYIDRDCRTFKRYRLHWLNKFGVWDSFTFRMESEQSTSVQRQTYEGTLGRWYDIERTDPIDPTTAKSDFYVSLEDGQKKSYATTATDTVTVNTDWFKQEVQNWLMKSLIESPTVLMEDENGFEQVILSTDSFKIKKRRRDGLIQESVKFTRTFRYNSQIQ